MTDEGKTWALTRLRVAASSTRLLLALLLPTAILAAPQGARPSDCGPAFLGAWEWNQGGRGQMRVIFRDVEDEPEAFRVEFRLIDTFDGTVYRGTASGALCAGELEGRVQDAGGTRFGFRGTFTDGEFRGEHFQLDNNDKQYDTGTLSFH